MKKFTTFLMLAFGVIVFDTSAQYCQATFAYSGTGNSCGQGTFSVSDVTGASTYLGNASSGFMGTANNSAYVSIKDIGAIPPGTYRLTLSNASSNVFRLSPVNVPDLYLRDGFLIHGYRSGQSRAQASRGCIILDANQRRQLRRFFDECNGDFLVQVWTN